jgi:8-amino-7-oxononanoate synthase
LANCPVPMTVRTPEIRVPEKYAGIVGLQEAGLWDQVIDEVDGRRIRIGERWLTDFASCNYLGLDLDPEVIDAVDGQVRRWGTHPSWSRMLGQPRLYPMIEERLTALTGAPDTIVLPTISQIHLAVIPLLAGDGVVFLDARAHRTIYDGAMHARAQGASVQRFRANDVAHLRELLRDAPAGKPKLVCMDGINSMTGNPPPVAEFAAVCREYGALLYIDDAHGFGVIGERRPDESSPYGARGNAVVRHTGESYDNIVLVGGLSKAYSSLLAFVACTPAIKRLIKAAAAPYLYSGPSPTASLATVLAGLDVNEKRGEALRGDLYRKTMRVLAEHVRLPDHRGAVAAPRGPARRRQRAAAAGHLRDARAVPGCAARGGRLPHPAHRREHRRADRPPARHADLGGQRIPTTAGAPPRAGRLSSRDPDNLGEVAAIPARDAATSPKL